MKPLAGRRAFVIHAFASLATSGAGCKHRTVVAAPLASTSTLPSGQVPPPAVVADASTPVAVAVDASVASTNRGIFAALGAPSGTIATGDGYGGRMGLSLRRGPLVRAAPPTVSGLLSPEFVRRVVLRNLAQVSHCHEQGLARNPNAEGRIVVRFVVSGTGTVQSSAVQESSYPIASVATCIAAAVRRWQFPAPEGGGIVTVNYPFNLQHPE